jgi:hypothetical protein
MGTRQICPHCQTPFFVGKPGPGANLNKTMMAGEQGTAPRPPIRYTCPNCDKPLEAPAEQAGTKRHCPFCSQRLQVPAPSGSPNLNRTLLAAPSDTSNLNRTMLAGSEVPGGAGAAHGASSADGRLASEPTPAASAWMRQLTPIHLAIGGGALLLVLLVPLVLVVVVVSTALRGGKAVDPAAVANAPSDLDKLRREIEQKQAELERQAREEAEARKQMEVERRRLRDLQDDDARAKLQQKAEQEQQQRDRDRQDREQKTQQALEDAQRKLEETKRALEELQQKQPKEEVRGGTTVIQPPPRSVAPDPGTLQGFPIGRTFLFEVTGATDGGAVWGTDVYTSDSNLSTAAVHAGVLRPGESGVVLVRTLPGRPSYAGSQRRGVSSSSWDAWSESYTISRAP